MHCRPLAQDTMAGVGMVSDAWGKMSAASQQAGGWRGVVERGFVAQVMRHPLHTHPRTLGWEDVQSSWGRLDGPQQRTRPVSKPPPRKADPRQQQDWILKCLQGGCANPLAICRVPTLYSPPRTPLETEPLEP
jgi:hypothetical protein